jgi:hypothetical protein
MDCEETEQPYETGRKEEEKLERMFEDFCNHQANLEENRVKPKVFGLSSNAISENSSS